jgi:hypothetical protein
LLAKSDVDNVGAGRAAKGASPGRSTSSLFRHYAPYCLNHGKSFETKGFLSIGTLFDRWVSAKNKGEWRKLFAFAVFLSVGLR